MARRAREATPSVAKRLTKKLPKLSPLLREGFKSLWTDEQCDAWARRAKPADVLAQAQDWVGVLATALEGEGRDDLPYTRQRLAWLVELTVQLEDAVSGTPKAEVVAARRAREDAQGEAKHLRARLHCRMLLLVGGDHERGAALAIASKAKASPGELASSLSLLTELLARWRKDARLRVLAEEVGLDDAALERATAAARLLADTDTQAEALAPSRGGPLQRIEGRVLRELYAVQVALAAAKEDGLAVPSLKVRAVMKSALSMAREADRGVARIAFLP